MGGMFGESKFKILDKIPQAYKAKTIFIKHNSSFIHVLQQMNEAGLIFPVIFKPDLGERGYRVKRIANEAEAQQYISTFKFDFLVQELVDLPEEFGVFYRRLPSQIKGEVFSIVGKELLTVTGNGKSSLQELILSKDRAKLQWDTLKLQHTAQLNRVIPSGEIFLLNAIGNHCLGTTFLNSNHLISEELNNSFDKISNQIEGFYYGRFDLRCESVAALTAGRIKILELNGCGAEPAHIYQPGFSFWKAVGVMFTHWHYIFKIAQENNKLGAVYLTYTEAKMFYQKFKTAVQP
ncbi:hypothetical protein SanaruYs_14080 [Chryseotalea sanaruensis]|uniref:ATP-grasp domain-containing protein n=2 Tax=Chryseotalea sanaruensis TaxID=2482724 RepID=A0A401U8G2_9BACT|nr:hypothetical protein SanaruYs_14080 [Chryseotalea sanaruensis]